MRIKGLHIVAKRKPGRPVVWYVYAYRGGPQIMVKTGTRPASLTPEAEELYREAMVEARAVKANTLAGLLRDYTASSEWKALARGTRINWERAHVRLEKKWGDISLSIFDNPRMVTKVMEWRKTLADRPREADQTIAGLRHALEWGRLAGKVRVNIAAGIPSLYRGGDRAEIVWTEDDCERFDKGAPVEVSDIRRLACLTGFRRADLAAVTFGDVGEHAIVRIARKKSRGKRRRVVVPLIPALKALIDELRTRARKDGVDTLLVNSRGLPWTGDGLGNTVTRRIREVGIKHIGEDDDGNPVERWKHLHDCRGTFATELIKSGLTDQEAAGILGWAPERVGNIRDVYVDPARVVMALSERLAGIGQTEIVNRSVNQREAANGK